MLKCSRNGCNNEQKPSERWDGFCSDTCGAIVMGEGMERAFAGFSGFVLRPQKPEGEE